MISVFLSRRGLSSKIASSSETSREKKESEMTIRHRSRSNCPLSVILALLAILILGQSRALAQPTVSGEWSPVIDTENVLIHAHLLPNGKVLFWSRREISDGANLNPQVCTTRILDPTLVGKPGMITQPANQPGYNLFCSSHTFLPDGRLFVAGGHISDSHGSPHAAIYDPVANAWTRIDDTLRGRWYPTVTPLPDGGVLVSFGSDQNGDLNDTQQVWKDNQWRTIVNFDGPPLYPRMHALGNARVFMSGPLPTTQFLDTSGAGSWTPLNDRPSETLQDYAPSVMYDDGKILYLGGGIPPLNNADIVDLNAPTPQWKAANPMHFPRRQHNATLLPDGTVLVTGGTRGDGGETKGFNDLCKGQPVHEAELWDPKTGRWTVVATEGVDRCYHSTAVLLPDATVLSAGGGEYDPRNNGHQNDPIDTHRDAQIFKPPYLFLPGPRPEILSAPDLVTYGQTFTVATSVPGQIAQVNWVRLSSVTHSFNTNQRINFLKFTGGATALSVTAPASANLCLPGHYMLFVLNKDGFPSTAKIVRIH
jgi:galactose oxidase